MPCYGLLRPAAYEAQAALPRGSKKRGGPKRTVDAPADQLGTVGLAGAVLGRAPDAATPRTLARGIVRSPDLGGVGAGCDGVEQGEEGCGWLGRRGWDEVGQPGAHGLGCFVWGQGVGTS